jgi:hypothetical protein
VRLASQGQRSSLTGLVRTAALWCALASSALLSAACRDNGLSDDYGTSVEIDPPRPVVSRPSTITIDLRDRANRPWPDARLVLEAHMEHPGMAPIIMATEARARGVYATSMTFTMAGRWIFYLSGDLPDGRKIRSRVADVEVAPSGE